MWMTSVTDWLEMVYEATIAIPFGVITFVVMDRVSRRIEDGT